MRELVYREDSWNLRKFDWDMQLDHNKVMGSKRLWKWSGLILFGLMFVAVCCGYLFSTIQTFVAWDQMYVFREYSRIERVSNDPKEIAQCLRSIARDYPSGTKQKTGNCLDKMVEIAREAYARLCIEHLRKLTQKDLGDDPKAWIEAYDK